MPVIRAHSYSNILYIEYDVEALIMDVSSSWKGGKALIYTHRFPGIFIGLAKCHYTAGGEVMNCNKLWCGWVCVSCHWLINRNTVTNLKRSTILPPPVIFSNAYSTHNHACVQVQTHRNALARLNTHIQYVHMETRRRLFYVHRTVFPFMMYGSVSQYMWLYI